MKLVLSAIFVCLTALVTEAYSQTRRPVRPSTTAAVKPREIGQTAYVMDETLSVLRPKPSLFAVPMQRMRRGRVVKILGVAEADGVKFYRVAAIPTGSGWVQADAVFGKFRNGDDARLARLVQSMSGFDQIEAATEFFNLFPTSPFPPHRSSCSTATCSKIPLPSSHATPPVPSAVPRWPRPPLRAEGLMEAALLLGAASPEELDRAMDGCYRQAFGRTLADDFGDDWREFYPFPQIPAMGRRAPVYPSTRD